MLLEWNDNINPYLDFRGCVKQFHDRLISPGTNVTHLADKSGQFDFDNEVLPSPVSTAVLTSQTSKPLYYKFTCVGKKEVFITLAFINVAYSSSYQENILGIIRVSDKFKEYDGYNSNDSVIPVSRVNFTYETYLTASCNFIHINSKNNIIGGTYGYIFIDETTGVLSFGCALGLYLPNESRYKKYPLIWCMIRTSTTGIMFTRPYSTANITNDSSEVYNNINSGVTSVAINNVGIAQQHNLKDLTINDVETSAILEYYYINESGNLEVMPNVFVYNFKRYSEVGLNTIGTRTFYFLGDGISTFNLGLHDNLSFAFEVTE